MLPLVSINLLTYNAEKYIKSCLNSIFSQIYPKLEILIIDNASTDGTFEYLKKLPKRQNLKIVFNKKNIGFAAGHNQGIRKSKGEFILCLNQDVVLDNKFVQKAIEVFKIDAQVASVQGKLLRWNLSLPTLNQFADYKVSHIIDTTGLVIFKNRRIINREQGQINQEQFEKSEEIFGADGAAPVYRREALEDIILRQGYGGQVPSAKKKKDLRSEALAKEWFDEDFFCYKEDVDIAWRLRLYGWKSVYQPKSVAWHARTAGDSAAKNYFAIVRERLKINKFGKFHAFKNQRLMQLKNEQPLLFIKHLPWFLPKEIISWIYVLLFEKYTWRAIKDLFKLAPSAWRKRKIIMANKKVGVKEMEKWFK